MTKLIRFLKPFKISVAAVMLLVFVQTLTELYLPTLMADIVDTGIVRGDTPYIIRTGGFMLLIAAGGTICSIGASFLAAKIAVGLGRLLRSKVFSRVEDFSLHEFNQMGTATLITRTTNDINQIQTVTFMILRMMLFAPMMGIGGIIMGLLPGLFWPTRRQSGGTDSLRNRMQAVSATFGVRLPRQHFGNIEA